MSSPLLLTVHMKIFTPLLLIDREKTVAYNKLVRTYAVTKNRYGWGEKQMFTQNNSLRLIIIALFSLLIIATFTITGYFVFFTWKASAENMVSEIQDNTNAMIFNQIELFITTPLNMNQGNRSLIEKEIVNLSHKTEREVYFTSVIKSSDDEVYSFTYGTEQGDYYGARRNLKNQLEIIENNALTQHKSRYFSATSEFTAGALVQETGVFDPRTRDWYKIAKETGGPAFSPIYKHFVVDDLALSASLPIYDQKGFLKGVLGTHITLSKVNDFLEEAVKGKHVTAYIIEKQSGHLVANSTGQPNFTKQKDGSIQRVAVSDVNHPAIADTYQQFKATGKTAFRTRAANDDLHIKVIELHKEGLDWLIITLVPQSPFIAGITESIHFSILISILAICLAIAIYVKGTEIILKPVYHLIKTTEQFSKGDFSQRAQVFRKDEIGKLAVAFNEMADQLAALINTLEERIQDRTKKLEGTVVELKESRERYEALLNQSSEAVVVVDLETTHPIEVNEAFLQIFDCSRLELNALFLSERLPLTPETVRDMASILLQGASLPLLSGSYPQKDGRLIYWEGIASLIRHGNDQLLLISYRDVTSQKQAALEKMENQKKIALMERMASLGTLSAGVAHEINQPLQALKVTLDGMIYWYEKGKGPTLENLIDKCRHVSSHADRISRIVKQLRDFVNRSQTSHNEPVDLNDICVHALGMVQERLRVHNIRLHENFSAEPLILWGDSGRLEEVILNVVINALQALDSVSQQEKEIVITTGKTAQAIQMTICNNGPAIPNEIMAKIFDPFFSTRISSDNMGLGLAIVHSIVEAHQGTVRASNSPDGVCFTFDFPIFSPE